jgi:D-glycero-beta-D-manno-heptose-7-phosphate kinase
MDTLQQKQSKILLIGEICEDIYIFGNVDRISPEAPVPVLKYSSRDIRKGMAGNVYDNILGMSCNTKIDFWCNKHHKIKKIRYIDEKSKYQIMRYDIEKSLQALSESKINNCQSQYNAIVISDYDKGFLNSQVIETITSKFKNSKIFIDTKKKDLSCLKNSIIKLNEIESLKSQNRHNSSQIITTLGARGCEFNDVFYPTAPVEVYDVCGAGDVFLAALVVRWLETKDLIDAIKTANNCAALSVTKLGCYTLKRAEYENIRV